MLVKLDCDLWDIYLVVGDLKEVEWEAGGDLLKDRPHKDSPGLCCYRYKKVYLWIKKDLPLKDKVCVIYHEVGHALIHIYERKNWRIYKKNSEKYLRLQDDLADQCIHWLTRR